MSMTTRQTPDAVREAAIEFLAKAAESAGCVEVPKGLRGGDIALVSSEIAISAILAALDSRAGDAFAMPEYAPDDISHLEGLASYIDGVARDKGRAGLPASKSLFEEIAKRLREYDLIRSATPAPAVDAECPSSPDGKHQVDTSMESGPNNCFHCEAPMGGRHAR